jgi:DNA-binding NarL/FixJ family response regulator
MNAVLGYADLILDDIFGEVPEPIRDTLERIKSNGQHLLGLINDVLDLSKIEAGQLTLSLGDYSMGEVVHAVVSAVESLAAAKNLALKAIVPADLPAGRGDERRLTQVLLNLAGNAIKFTDAGGSPSRPGLATALSSCPSRYRPRNHRCRPAEDLRGVPTGRQLQHPHQGGHRPRTLDLPAHRGAARRPPLGGAGAPGYEATRRIKANPALRHIPVIVVTSYALSGDDVKAFEAGCDTYVTKPFVPRQLLAKVANIWRHQRRGPRESTAADPDRG